MILQNTTQTCSSRRSDLQQVGGLDDVQAGRAGELDAPGVREVDDRRKGVAGDLVERHLRRALWLSPRPAAETAQVARA